ncbi:PcfJ domain-containing protein [Hymenobacter endophyticus]|uniref:PcfJ domain-containing protein n=1 Tax=Hymenobacter endophyticus TaxID=3076335 RepID=A0ABU3TMV8_9BACT|nr:PcfJ domain-containing protein [Hymenobacter endophyticus]MDU0372712.1 PcfJ domain-containing protein [Hymenobacter endophyticus]
MSNRNKPLSVEVQTTRRVAAVLANRPAGHKWPLARQIEFICTRASVAEVHAGLEPDAVAALLYCHCLHGRSSAEQEQARCALRALVKCRTNILTRVELVPAVAALTRLYQHRRRNLADWRPHRRNAFRQLYSLVGHLFDGFGDVPGWVLEAWATGQLTQHGVDMALLTVHVGSGKSLRSFPGLPVPLSRRLEHEMRQAPYAYTLVPALRYAQLAATNALALLPPLLVTPLGREITPQDAFWLNVVEFFREASMVDYWQLGPVCEWIEVVRTVGTNGQPPHPGFSLKGRCMQAVLAQAGQWHRRTHRARKYWGYNVALTSTWAGLPVANYASLEAGRVQITQLLSYAALVEEGSSQKHCVSSYVYSCLRGRCGIFSLRVNGARALTLEVRANRQLVQIRGRENRRATEQELHWLRQWAEAAGLSIGATAC